MEWIQLSLRVSWLLGVWLSARESLERDGYLFLRRKVSSTLYTYTTVRVPSSRNVNCIRVRECACLPAYTRYVSPGVRCHSPHFRKLVYCRSLYFRCRPQSFRVLLFVSHLILHLACCLTPRNTARSEVKIASCDLRLMILWSTFSIFFYLAYLASEFAKIVTYRKTKLQESLYERRNMFCFLGKINGLRLSPRVMRKIKRITF